jgi:membrane glycosyltransferase
LRANNYLLIPEETKSPAVLRRAWQHASQLALPLLLKAA